MPSCRSCKAPIEFTETAHGRLMPVDVDGTSHFATCPASPRNQRPPLPDDVCLACGSQDVERRPGTGPHHGAIKCRDCGVFRWLRKPVTA